MKCGAPQLTKPDSKSLTTKLAQSSFSIVRMLLLKVDGIY